MSQVTIAQLRTYLSNHSRCRLTLLVCLSHIPRSGASCIVGKCMQSLGLLIQQGLDTLDTLDTF